MIYALEFFTTTQADMARLKRSEPLAFKKLIQLLEELREHPTVGTSHPKPLGRIRRGNGRAGLPKNTALSIKSRKKK
jgi:toxin YoeB